MTDLWMLSAGLLAALAAGAAFGTLYFALLWWGTRRFIETAVKDGPVARWLLVGFALRLALAAGALVLVFRAGAGAPELLAATLGFTLARQALIRRMPRRQE